MSRNSERCRFDIRTDRSLKASCPSWVFVYTITHFRAAVSVSVCEIPVFPLGSRHHLRHLVTEPKLTLRARRLGLSLRAPSSIRPRALSRSMRARANHWAGSARSSCSCARELSTSALIGPLNSRLLHLKLGSAMVFTVLATKINPWVNFLLKITTNVVKIQIQSYAVNRIVYLPALCAAPA